MADEKFSQLGAATDFNDSDLFALAVGVDNKSAAYSLLKTKLKAYLDAYYEVINAVSTHNGVTNPHSATNLATADRLMLRDAAGRAKVVDGSASSDIATKGQVDTKSADLDMLTHFLLPGRYHCFPSWGTISTLSLTAGTVYAVPYLSSVTRLITGIGFTVTSTAASTARLAVYIDGGNISPYNCTRVQYFGEVSTSTTGFKEVTGFSVSLTANVLYWLALESAGAIGVRATSGGFSMMGYTTSAPDLSAIGSCVYTGTYTYSSFPPSTYDGTITPAVGTTLAPRIVYKFS